MLINLFVINGLYVNLTKYYFKYTPENGRVTVSLSCVADFRGKKAVQVQVSDTGKGIPKEHLPHVFERFYKVDDAASGSGIGLNLAKMLVELHDGSISVESEYGKGTCFTVVIPREEHGATADVALPEADVLQVEPKSERGEMWQQYATDNIIAADNQEVDAGMPLVLIVEDNADMRLYLKILLSDAYTTIEAENGVVGLQLAMRQIPELIVSDVMMDEMNGFELCKQLKNNLSTCHIPVILLTACSLDEQRVEGFESGADAYIPKPFNDKLLKIRIRKLIENRAHMKEYFRENLTFGEGKKSLAGMDKTFMDKFRQIVMDNLSDNELSVDEIGRQIGLSRIQLYRKIKALTNYAPNELVRIIRLKEAERLLTHTEMTISEVAYETGFSSPAYFAKCFREYFKESPTAYLEHVKPKR